MAFLPTHPLPAPTHPPAPLLFIFHGGEKKIKEMKTITLSFYFLSFFLLLPQNSRKACHSAGNDTRFGELSLMRTRAKIINDKTGNSANLRFCLIDGVLLCIVLFVGFLSNRWRFFCIIFLLKYLLFFCLTDGVGIFLRLHFMTSQFFVGFLFDRWRWIFFFFAIYHFSLFIHSFSVKWMAMFFLIFPF